MCDDIKLSQTIDTCVEDNTYFIDIAYLNSLPDICSVHCSNYLGCIHLCKYNGIKLNANIKEKSPKLITLKKIPYLKEIEI